jgi:hypothetical protein
MNKNKIPNMDLCFSRRWTIGGIFRCDKRRKKMKQRRGIGFPRPGGTMSECSKQSPEEERE